MLAGTQYRVHVFERFRKTGTLGVGHRFTSKLVRKKGAPGTREGINRGEVRIVGCCEVRPVRDKTVWSVVLYMSVLFQ